MRVLYCKPSVSRTLSLSIKSFFGGWKMNPIINFMNWLTDMDWGWWPLLRFRPPKDEYIDNIVVLKITPFFGTVFGILIAIIWNHLHSPARIFLDVLNTWVLFFILYRITFAPAWNSRARILRKIRAE